MESQQDFGACLFLVALWVPQYGLHAGVERSCEFHELGCADDVFYAQHHLASGPLVDVLEHEEHPLLHLFRQTEMRTKCFKLHKVPRALPCQWWRQQGKRFEHARVILHEPHVLLAYGRCVFVHEFVDAGSELVLVHRLEAAQQLGVSAHEVCIAQDEGQLIEQIEPHLLDACGIHDAARFVSVRAMVVRVCWARAHGASLYGRSP